MKKIYKYFRFLPKTAMFRSQIVGKLTSLGVVEIPRIFLHTSNGELAGIYGVVLSDEADESTIEDYIAENEYIENIEEEAMAEYRKQYESIDIDQSIETLNI